MNGIPDDVLLEAYRVLVGASGDATINPEKSCEAWDAAEKLRPYLERRGLLHAARAA